MSTRTSARAITPTCSSPASSTTRSGSNAGDRSSAASEILDRARVPPGPLADAGPARMPGSGMTTTARFGGHADAHGRPPDRHPLGGARLSGSLCVRRRSSRMRARARSRAVLLMINPLYSLQAHRAMADVPCEAFMLSSLAVWLSMWARIWSRGIARWPLSSFPGSPGSLPACRCCASSTASSGSPSSRPGAGSPGWCRDFRSVASWRSPARRSSRSPSRSSSAVAFNPYLTAKPAGNLPKKLVALLDPKNVWQRFRHQVDFRLEISNDQKNEFPNDALFDLPEKARVILVQGFGRFGPFGPRAADSTSAI